jgi:hypothetical protein
MIRWCLETKLMPRAYSNDAYIQLLANDDHTGCKCWEKSVLDINLSYAVKVIHLTAPLCIENKLRSSWVTSEHRNFLNAALSKIVSLYHRSNIRLFCCKVYSNTSLKTFGIETCYFVTTTSLPTFKLVGAEGNLTLHQIWAGKKEDCSRPQIQWSRGQTTITVWINFKLCLEFIKAKAQTIHKQRTFKAMLLLLLRNGTMRQ